MPVLLDPSVAHTKWIAALLNPQHHMLAAKHCLLENMNLEPST
jgi:hypothetical protein